jgi:hypothetical protein
MSLFLMDGAIMKAVGFVGFFVAGYLITLAIAWLRGER